MERLLRRWLGLILAAAALLPLGRACGEEPAVFIPPKATVVILAGLAGDVESERSYTEQLRLWMDILAAMNGKPEQMHVLWDSADTMTFPAGLPVKTSKANREAFLGLGKSLAGSASPLVVIAWGHGGMQGNVPVLHVRGPRLTAEDFKLFAEQAGRTTSHWALGFRGSGQFAGAIAAPGRVILATERDTPFTQDPLGPQLLAQVLRERPALSLGELADAWGKATVDWYESRNLARTEEPTLWLGQKPRLLADAKAAELAESGKPMPVRNAPAEKEEGKQAPEVAALPAVWQEIQSVDAAAYPESDAVILRQSIAHTISKAPSLTSEHESFIQVLTEEGKHHGDFDFSFSPPDENLTILDCEVRRPDGKLIRLNPEDVREAGAAAVGDYRQAHRKFFSLPGVGPGAILHVRYRSEWKNYPLPHVSLGVPLAGSLPVLAMTVDVSVPRNAALHYFFDHAPSKDAELKQMENGTTYRWQFANLPARVPEALSPPANDAALLLSTFPAWSDFAGWYARISQETDKPTPEIEAKAKELTRDAKNDREKVQALFNYVTALRYVAVPLGVNSVRPHAAGNVFKNQFGDCKDKANLLNTMLHTLGMEAHLVLVPRFRQAHEAVPGMAFNHAISRVKAGDEILWLDTTDDVCRFGMLPPGDPGRRVLVIDGKSSELSELPAPKSSEHVLTVSGQLDASGVGDAVKAAFAITTSGFVDYDLRSAARNLERGDSTRSLLARGYRPLEGTFALSHQTFSSASDLSSPFAWNGSGRFVGLIRRTASTHRIGVPFWWPKSWDVALNERRTALFLHQGYPLKLDQRFEVRLPRSAGLKLPAPRSGDRDPLRWKIEWTQKAPGTFEAHLVAELLRGELLESETPSIQAELEKLIDAASAEPEFTPAP